MEFFKQRNEWLQETNKDFLKNCKLEWYQSTGPGGQKKNRKFSAVRLKHLPSGLTVTSEKSRSQYENSQSAVKKLKIKMAIEIRGPALNIDIIASNRDNKVYPSMIAKIFDELHYNNFSLSHTAAGLNISTSKLIKFLAKNEVIWREVNLSREKRGMKILKI